MIDYKIDGLSQLLKALDQVPIKLEKKVLRGALRAGAKVLQQDAKSLVPGKTGKLRESIRLSAGIFSSKGRVWAKITAGGNKKGDPFYAHMVEFGTKPHVINLKNRKLLANSGDVFGKTVSHPGIKPQSFMRKALDRSAQKALDQFRDEIARRLSELIK